LGEKWLAAADELSSARKASRITVCRTQLISRENTHTSLTKASRITVCRTELISRENTHTSLTIPFRTFGKKAKTVKNS